MKRFISTISTKSAAWRSVPFLVLMLCTSCSYSATQLAESSGPDQGAPPAAGSYPPFGFTTFPYAATMEAVDRTHEIARDNGAIYAIHRDNGIPWFEALNNKPYPKKVRESWEDYARRRPSNVPVYLALSPLGEDRETLIYASEGSKKPNIFKNSDLNDKDVIRAYKNYVFKAIEIMDPDFLNLGIEAGELAYRKPREWAKFTELYFEVARDVKREYPNLSIGISFGLQTFLEAGVVERSQALIDKSDFIGISFYPYMSSFHERYGAAPLDAPPQEWRKPLAKLHAIATKPIAICETGYTSKPVEVPKHRLSMNGSPSLQQTFLQELGSIASRDNYAFVIWFMPVDYDRLFDTLPPGDGTYRLWQNIGVYDKDLRAKPALDTWQAIIAGKSAPVAHVPRPSNKPSPPTKESGSAEILAFNNGPNGFLGSSKDDVKSIATQGSSSLPSTITHSLDWSYKCKKGRWQYIQREIEKGSLANTQSVTLYLKSNQTGPILMQLEEQNGEAFFSVLMPSTNWAKYTIPFKDLDLSEETRKNGKLSANTIKKILFADTGAVSEGATGKRTVQIGRIEFH